MAKRKSNQKQESDAEASAIEESLELETPTPVEAQAAPAPRRMSVFEFLGERPGLNAMTREVLKVLHRHDKQSREQWEATLASSLSRPIK